MSEPVQLVARRIQNAGWCIYIGHLLVGNIDYGTDGDFIGWYGGQLFEKRGCNFTREAAAIALAKACGIPNPIPPEVWP